MIARAAGVHSASDEKTANETGGEILSFDYTSTAGPPYRLFAVACFSQRGGTMFSPNSRILASGLQAPIRRKT